MRFVETFDTAAPPAAAFAYLADFTRLPEWDPSVVRAERLSRGPEGPGSRFRVTLRFLGVESTLVYRVSVWEPPARAVLVGRAPAARATDSIRVEPAGRGSRVTWDADIRLAGLFAWLDPVVAWLFAPNVRAAVGNLREALDGLAHAPRAGVGGRRRRVAGAPAAGGGRRRRGAARRGYGPPR